MVAATGGQAVHFANCLNCFVSIDSGMLAHVTVKLSFIFILFFSSLPLAHEIVKHLLYSDVLIILVAMYKVEFEQSNCVKVTDLGVEFEG